MKTCCYCRISKEETEFGRDKERPDQLAIGCSKCTLMKSRRNKLLRVYKITWEEYKILWKRQKGRCAICNQRETSKSSGTKKPRRLSVDHDHTTNQNRGLLCQRCNALLGQAFDSPVILRAAADYLEKYVVENKIVSI